MKYVFKQIDSYTPSETTVEFEADSLETILEQFEMFLKGSGYQISGTLDIVYPDEEINYDGINIDLSSSEHEQYLWDINAIGEKPFNSEDIVLDLGAAQPAINMDFNRENTFFDYDYANSATDTTVMAHVAADLLRQMENKELAKERCSVCGLDAALMRDHTCFDKNCPLQEPLPF